MSSLPVLRYAAFTDGGQGGNPAGIVFEAGNLTSDEMLAIAAGVGDSRTAFLDGGDRAYDVRYFSPVAELAFCGHATVAAAVALAHRDGPGDLVFRTAAGNVPIATRTESDGATSATLTSVAPRVREADPDDLALALALLRWKAEELDPALPAAIAYAGAQHLIVAAASRERLARLDYDFAGLKAYMLERDLVTVALVWREDTATFHARNPFPVEDIVEDPATGAAAAALGAYLRHAGAVAPPARVRILQGHDMGSPSELFVDIDAARPEIRVSGRADAIADRPACSA